uniref:Annexin D4-like n=1 Tax=Nicotiana sylvestris TaxID=4096 RepID=A0A1U7Y6N3_NICSY|nr:PREDICTED: annexin D4-like [Nicotiana sylvestris]
MAEANAYAALTKAFSGLGVDENLFISTLGNWNRHQRESYRVSTPGFFKEDERQFQRWDDQHILQLRQEFLRLKVF